MQGISAKKSKYPVILSALLMIFIVAHPLIDVVTAINSRTGIGLSIGVVLRALFMAVVVIHVLFFYHGKFKKYLVGYIFLLGAYCVVYFANIFVNSDLYVVIANLRESIKTVYFPIAFVGLFAVYDEYGFTVGEDALAYVGITFCSVIFIADILGVGYPSYEFNPNGGSVGFFYSANEISTIIVILVPVVFMWLCRYVRSSENRFAASVISIAALFVCVYAAAFVGTKVAYFGLAAYALCGIIWSVINLIAKKDFKSLSRTVMCAVLGLLLVSVYFISPIYRNLNSHIEDNYQSMAVEGIDKDDASPIYYKEALEENADSEEELEEEMSRIENDYREFRQNITSSSAYKWVNWVTSNRFNFLIPTHYSFVKAPALSQIIGLGYKNTNVCEFNIEKSVELDVFSILYRHGVIGLVIMLLPFVICAFYVLKCLFVNIKRTITSFAYCSYLFTLLMGFGIGFITGHTLVAPAVSIYIAIIMVNITKICREAEKSRKADNAERVRNKSGIFPSEHNTVEA